jgi:hypothetical protein
MLVVEIYRCRDGVRSPGCKAGKQTDRQKMNQTWPGLTGAAEGPESTQKLEEAQEEMPEAE